MTEPAWRVAKLSDRSRTVIADQHRRKAQSCDSWTGRQGIRLAMLVVAASFLRRRQRAGHYMQSRIRATAGPGPHDQRNGYKA